MSSGSLMPPGGQEGQSAAAGLLELWRHPATGQKLLALGLLIASIAVGSYGAALLMRSSDHVLYSNLSETDAANVVERLRASNIDARLSDNGHSVLIDQSDLERARLAQASEGGPATTPSGWGLFDQTGFGMTDFQEKVTYQRALEGEIARTVGALDEVSDARVHLAIPSDSIYPDESTPTASISLTLHRQLEPRGIQAIVNLVASAVEGLTPANVVVIDSYGRTLHAGGTDPLGDGLSDDQLARKSSIEQELAAKAVSILQPLVGPGKVRARATIDMDFDRSEETIETFDPQGSVIRSQRLDEQRQGDAEDWAAARGVPGTRANPPLPGATENESTDAAESQDDADTEEVTEESSAVIATASPSGITKKSETINYEVSKRVRHVSTPVGRVGRRSVAVVVDDATVETDDGPQRQPYADEDVEKFNALVIAALGLDVANGDTVTVSNISFDDTEVVEPEVAPSFVDRVRPFLPLIIKNLSWVGLILGFYMMIFRPLMKKISEPVALRKVATALPDSPLPNAGLGPGTMGDFSAPHHQLQQGAGAPDILTRAQQMSQQSPEAAGNLVRNWLQEDVKR